MKVKAKVFEDNQGNRFIFQSYTYSVDDVTIPLETTFWSIGIGMNMATGIKMLDGWKEFDDENFPHVVIDLISNGFAHGGATAYAFEGPLFDEIKIETKDNTEVSG